MDVYWHNLWKYSKDAVALRENISQAIQILQQYTMCYFNITPPQLTQYYKNKIIVCTNYYLVVRRPNLKYSG